MTLFRKMSAYFNGRFKCKDMNLKFPPSCVYNYNEKLLDIFISGLISASTDEGEFYRYNHASTVMLTNLQKLINDAGYKTALDTNYLDIYKTF